jgi:acetyl esterase/lipase
MKKILTATLLLLSLNSFPQKKDLIYLWPGKVPGEIKEKQKPVIDTIKKDGVLRFVEITNPAVEIWLPEGGNNKKAGIIVCPGGAYRHLAYDKEGTEVAAWLNRIGYTAFVLSYRVPNNMTGALQDAQRALRIIRQNAAKWKIDPSKLGIMGFSAGGSLSARASTLYNKRTYTPVDAADSLSCRPDFALPIYPGLLDQGQNRTLTPEIKITSETPQMFIFQAADDPIANSSLVLAAALRESGIPVELHLVPQGGHGFGLRPGNPAAETWPEMAEKWLSKILQRTK